MYSSKTLGFSPEFQNSDTPRKHWVSVPCFKTHIFTENTGFQFSVSRFKSHLFIGNSGFQSQASKLTYSSHSGFQSYVLKSHIHRKIWVSVPCFKTHIFTGNSGFQSNVSKLIFIRNTGFQSYVSKLTYSSKTLV